MFVDTHTHFYDEWLLSDAEEAIQRALDAGVEKMIQADVDSRERPAMWEVGSRHPGVLFQMLGLYPGSVNENWRDELDQVFAIASGERPVLPEASAVFFAKGSTGLSPVQDSGVRDAIFSANKTADAPKIASLPPGAPSIVAIGEIGLDYHEGKEYVREQKEVLRLQLELAAKLDLPVNIHLRDAWEDFFQVLSDCKHLHLRGNLHCFTASYEIFERATRLADFSVGIGGVVTFKNASLAKTLEPIPLEKILLETDAPYLAPVPWRGRRNESAYIPLIADKVAQIKGLSLQEIETITTHNAETLFGI